ncbi:MAG: PSD1 and planctomycete cytochrome C domain-containing protein [Chthoniobacter sp.]|nr:PSD1 and planctomycete cytochrome C domain-containing protein [Chthoniobacter sp.]
MPGLASGLAWLLVAASAVAADLTPEQTDFFEKRIRPVLSEQCYKCHSSTSEKLKGGLMLDTREAMLKGGDTGPAIEPGNLDKSLLVEAIRWQNKDLQMPPKKALTVEQVADLETWVKGGALWPVETGAKVATKKVFDLQKRKQEHWCWQPVVDAPPPPVKSADWPRNAVDHFILAKLEEKGLHPAPPADRRTLIRRVSFDLTGLPPTPEEVDAFVNDPSPEALAKVVDRLLASPHFGERWARHWLDLVRYAETRGHEFDPAIPNAWQYRDYVIRALNSDLPYNQFTAEHLAGDLLPPRLNPQTGANEALLATGFWFLGEESHSPVDIQQDEADRMDNRLDVMGKTFLGVTLGCARCHDHKFDAISQRDYYAMQGFLISSSYRQARFETLEPHRQIAQQLEQARTASRATLLKAVAEALDPGIARLAGTLIAARDILRVPDGAPLPDEGAGDPAYVKPLVEELRVANGDVLNPLHAFAKIALARKTDEAAEFTRTFAPVLANLEKHERPAAFHFGPEQIVADYTRPDITSWIQDGFSFGLHPLRAGDPLFGGAAGQPLLGINSVGAAVRDAAWQSLAVKDSEHDYARLGGWDRSEKILRTPEVTLAGEQLWYLVKGGVRAYAVVNSHLLINGPLHGALLKEWPAGDGQWHWVQHPLKSYAGHRLHVEFSPADSGDCAVAMVVQADSEPPLPMGVSERLLSGLHDAAIASPVTLAGATQRVLAGVCDKLRADQVTEDDAALADWLVRKLDVFAPAVSSARQQLAETARPLLARQSELIARIRPESPTAPAMFDGSGVDEFLLVRGQAKTPGAQIPRRFLEAIAGPDQPVIKSGSGRLELARRVVDPANPLTSRVIVNRVWYHLFGRGIVPTVDNFGVLGQPPSHRELLDYLATHFVHEQGWSLKTLVREIVLSRAYQMSSQPADAVAEQADPDNLLIHRMNLRRLEGEAIRDAILSVSGRLDPQVGGPSVPVYLSEFMDGRGRPSHSGPLDGDGRRSVYIAVRRNFLSPMMLAFDTPIPFNAMGRRNVSNVPAQALILMNDPFVVGQAKLWAQRLPANLDPAARVRQMYLTAFSRPPTADELAGATAFLAEQRALYATPDPADERVWADLAHVLFNVKEFIYLN